MQRRDNVSRVPVFHPFLHILFSFSLSLRRPAGRELSFLPLSGKIEVFIANSSH
jgi:hypothetical protein